MIMELYQKNNLDCSRITTRNYSSSFAVGVRLLGPRYREGIYSIYGFVRYADEIVDTFFDQDQRTIFDEFRQETLKAVERRFSINPIIDSFQRAVHTYGIEYELVDAFLKSMEMDLTNEVYSPQMLKTYIYGSAEVVGLMCLRVFYSDDPQTYDRLIGPARKLGEAFQKVNFLRDAHDDYRTKGRIYFNNIDFDNFNIETKRQLEAEIKQDFLESMQGIRQLKKQVRLGVYLAYRYYFHLLKEIEQAEPGDILKKRYRVTGTKKSILLLKAFLRNSLNVF